MPFYVIRRSDEFLSILGTVEYYVSKRGVWVTEFKKARIFTTMTAVKNSIAHWRGSGDNDAEIVELELQPTGQVITVGEVMEPLRERRLKLIQERRAREDSRQRDQELEELKRLSEKYGPRA